LSGINLQKKESDMIWLLPKILFQKRDANGRTNFHGSSGIRMEWPSALREKHMDEKQ
jgi:hypothetical protein